MADAAQANTPGGVVAEELLKVLSPDWGWILAGGIIAILVGIAAIAVPYAATVGITIFIGAFLLAEGIVEIVRAFRHTKLKGWWWWALMGLLYALAGAILLFRPFEGAAALTLVLAIVFIVKGISALIMSFTVRPLPNWGWLAVSGVASLVVGILLAAGWPSTAIWAIGLLVGIDLIFSGWSLVFLAFAAKKVAA